jgi:hypothetical protein
MGHPKDEVRAALKMCSNAGLAFFDEEAELAWIPNVAEIELGDGLAVKDKRREGIKKHLRAIGQHRFVDAFMAKYGIAYGLLEAGQDVPDHSPPTPPYCVDEGGTTPLAMVLSRPGAVQDLDLGVQGGPPPADGAGLGVGSLRAAVSAWDAGRAQPSVEGAPWADVAKVRGAGGSETKTRPEATQAPANGIHADPPTAETVAKLQADLAIRDWRRPHEVTLDEPIPPEALAFIETRRTSLKWVPENVASEWEKYVAKTAVHKPRGHLFGGWRSWLIDAERYAKEATTRPRRDGSKPGSLGPAGKQKSARDAPWLDPTYGTEPIPEEIR